MDPRHPELSIERMDELMKQYKKLLADMRTSNVSNKIAQSERECGLVVQEICLVSPRLHEAMMQVSRTRRAALARGIVIEEKPVEKPVEEKKEEEKPKKTTKKKTSKKKKAK